MYDRTGAPVASSNSFAMRTLPASDRSPATARSWTRARLRDWRLSALQDDALLIVSELVSNAVRVGGRVTLEMRTAHRAGRHALRIDVVDEGRGLPGRVGASAPPDVAACHGRGLPLVDSLAEAWGSECRVDGHHVWAALRHSATAGIAGAAD